MKTQKIRPAHPGEHLKELLDDWGVSQYRLAKATGIPHSRITSLVHGRQGFTAATASRIARAFGMDPRFWLNLQQRYDLDAFEAECGEELAEISAFPKVSAGGCKV